MSIYIVHTIFPLIMPRRICFDHQELVTLVIIYLILMTFTFDSMVILYGEFKSRSLLGVSDVR